MISSNLYLTLQVNKDIEYYIALEKSSLTSKEYIISKPVPEQRDHANL